MNNFADFSGRALVNPTVGNFQTWDNNPAGVKVFILAGQSNMVGHGKSEKGHDVDEDGFEDLGGIGSLRYLAVNDTPNSRRLTDPLQHLEFDGTVFTADTRPFYREASVSPSSPGFHWNHNGESHYLIGESMGRAMLDF